MRDVLDRMELLAAWLKPGGSTPIEPIPDKYSTLVEAIAELKRHRAALTQRQEGADEIDRLQEAKRRFSENANRSAKEANGLRQALNRIQAVLLPIDDADHVETVGRAREIALSALNAALGK
jgi:hypothetical protein